MTQGEMNLPGEEVSRHRDLQADGSGQKFWCGIAVEGARGFRSSEEMDRFSEMGGRIALPVSICFDPETQDPTLPGMPDSGRQQHLFVAGVTRLDSEPVETLADILRSFS